MRRHKIKRDRNDRNRCAIVIAKEDGLSRVEKIDLLNRCGYGVSRKANSQRVERAFEKAHENARSEQQRAEELRMARNRRKAIRRKRGF